MRKFHKKKQLFSPVVFIVTGLSVVLYICVLITGFKAPSLFAQTCANSVSCIKDLSGKYEEGATGTFEGKPVPVPPPAIAQGENKQQVLGATSNKHIFVDLDHQSLIAYE